MADTKNVIHGVYNYLLTDLFPSIAIYTYDMNPKREAVYIEKLAELFKENDDYSDFMNSVGIFNKKLSWNIQRNSVTFLIKQIETIEYSAVDMILLLTSKKSKDIIFFRIMIITTFATMFTSSHVDDHGIINRWGLQQRIKNYEFVPSKTNPIYFYSFYKKPYVFQSSLSTFHLKKTNKGKKYSPPTYFSFTPEKKSDDDIMDVQKFYQYVINIIKKKEKEIIEGSLSKSYFDSIKNICKDGNVYLVKDLKTKEDIIQKLKNKMEDNHVIYLTGYEKKLTLGEDDVWFEEDFPSSAFCIIVSSKGSDTPIIFIKTRESDYVKMVSGVFSKEKIITLVEDMGIMKIPEKISFMYFYKKRFAECPELQSITDTMFKKEKASPKLKKKEEPLLFNPEYDCIQRASYGRRNVYSKEDLVKIAVTLKLFKTKSEASKMSKPDLCKYIKNSLSK
jgi:hypothetical protein